MSGPDWEAKYRKARDELAVFRARIDEDIGDPAHILGKRFVFASRLRKAEARIAELEKAGEALKATLEQLAGTESR